jgi:hypothetical protein
VSDDLVIRPARADAAPRIHDLHTVSVRALCSDHYAAEVIDGWPANRAPAAYLAEIERAVTVYAFTAVSYAVARRGGSIGRV